MTRHVPILVLALLLLVVRETALAAPAPSTLVDTLYTAARAKWPPASPSDPLTGASEYVIVPWKTTFFASTTHGVRGPFACDVWEYKAGRWSYVFRYEETLVEAPPEQRAAEDAAARKKDRSLWAQQGFSASMQERLVHGKFQRFPRLRGK